MILNKFFVKITREGYNRIDSMPKTSETSANLRLAIFLTSLVLIIEVIGAIKAGSLALLSDAAHVFGDVFALIITFTALKIASLPPNTRRTFGYHRAEIFAALINGLALLGLATMILIEAYRRFLEPAQVNGFLVILIGALGLLPNLWTAWKLRKETNLNIRSAFLHAASDALASLAIIVSGSIIAVSKIYILDTLASFAIAVLIILSGLRLLKNVLVILLEGVPPNFKLKEISRKLCVLEGVLGSHDLHLWTVCSDVVYLTGHLVVKEDLDFQKTRDISKNAAKLLELYGVHHTTFQIETPRTSCEKSIKCEIMH